MTGTLGPVYRALERESSNHLLEHDSRRALGHYEEAAYLALQAGSYRVRMGDLCWEAEEFVEAVEDWLSAAGCFLLATAKVRAAATLEKVRMSAANGKILADRSDLEAALREHDQQLEDLDQRFERFHRDFELQGHQVNAAEERTLRFLLQHVRDLPGYS